MRSTSPWLTKSSASHVDPPWRVAPALTSTIAAGALKSDSEIWRFGHERHGDAAIASGRARAQPCRRISPPPANNPKMGRIPDFPVTRSHPPASWPSAANSSICRTYRKTAGEQAGRLHPRSRPVRQRGRRHPARALPPAAVPAETGGGECQLRAQGPAGHRRGPAAGSMPRMKGDGSAVFGAEGITCSAGSGRRRPGGSVRGVRYAADDVVPDRSAELRAGGRGELGRCCTTATATAGRFLTTGRENGRRAG